jgi:putative addiction module killer protein
MKEIIKSQTFERWIKSLRDSQAKAKVAIRIRRLSLGNPGDVKPVGEGVSELRIDYGPGYRVYFIQDGPVVVVLLCGGDKRTQQRDIEQAKALASQWRDQK